MPPKKKLYAVSDGERSTIFETWAECEPYVKCRKRCRFKSFVNRADAERFAYGRVISQELAGPIGEDYAPETLEIWTDGATSNNGSQDKGSIRAGIGVWFGNGDPLNISEPFLLENPTNQRAEILAIIRAMEQLDAYEVEMEVPVVLYTDSKYCQNAYMKWIPNWRKPSVGWKTAKGTPVKNKELLEKMYDLLTKRKVTVKHVSGHAGIEGNEEADKLAVAGCCYGSSSSCEAEKNP
jgi:ribonuclease HI